MSTMNRPPSRILLLKGAPSSGRADEVAVKRYRIARARLDGRPAVRQSSASPLARSSRAASLPIP
jgi:hypothetical protein